MPADPAVEHGIDDVDRAIIAELQEDGRRPFTQIARDLGLAEATVRQRLHRLERRGVVQIVAVIAPLRLGLRRVLVGVRVRGHRLSDVEARLRVLPEVDYVAVTTGGYDLLLMAACADDAAVAELVTERIRSVPGVDTLDVVTILRETKDAYRYAAPR
ncbi:MAG: AsnC family transcriptional regulator [Candidatus Nanopelagicales bacterium]